MTAEERLRAAQDVLNAAQAAAADAVRDRDAAILAAREDGMGATRIAAVLGVERQAVYKVLRRA